MSWVYEQSTGRLYSPDGAHAATGYAGGNEGKNPEGVNNHAMQAMPNIGPLPVGFYTIGVPIAESKLGPFAIPLNPYITNSMFGRGDFYCHGDTSQMNHSASEGCIIMPRVVRNELAASTDKQLAVIYVKGGL